MSLLKKADEVRAGFFNTLQEDPARVDLEALRIEYLGRKGKVATLFKQMGQVAPEERAAFGQTLNQLKQELTEALDERESAAAAEKHSTEEAKIDLTLPGIASPAGTYHIITQSLNDMIDIFGRLGFSVAEGPEVESEWRNFDALNILPDHPARDMQDTFFTKSGHVLRTHTSPVQVRLMQSQPPPIRSIMPGKVYRNEAVSARSHAMFHQVEGLYVDKRVTFGELKGTLELFCREYFDEDVKLRFRPSFFPFTEPSSEVDISCFLCHGKGCRICKQTGWLEILGCGMVDPAVFEAVGYDPDKVTGYAFGIGIERPALLRYGIPDIRMFYENDLRFLRQF
ncbi:MAG: phenylalanine--tRNA ligase subunit alpha [Candidatus Marinimicrobia bacterium]|nr:phenylalanine--tRNA ligase subunit alpha [Candidatus Neomarinimicrobiota bacterium]MCF7840372.1 phenylalanine--tRNA ligase subunit alpha [Candidatus Neomarinimicrobiota bacterium]